MVRDENVRMREDMKQIKSQQRVRIALNIFCKPKNKYSYNKEKKF